MNEEKSFLDSRTVIAIVLVAVIWLGWQMHLTKKYAAAPGAAATPEAQMEPGKTVAPIDTVLKSGDAPTPTQEEKLVKYEDDVWSFDVSTKGMGLKNIVLKKYTDRSAQPFILGNETPTGAFGTALIGREQPLFFDVKIDGTKITGVAAAGAMKIKKEFVINSAQYSIDTNVTTEGMEPGIQGLGFDFSEKIVEPQSGGFLAPSTDRQSMFVSYGNTSKHENLSPKGEGKVGETFTNVNVAALGSLYFAKGLIDQSELRPQFDAEYQKTPEGLLTKGKISYIYPAGTSNLTLNLKAFAGPKELNLLTAVDPRLEGIVDYWVLGSIAKPMLRLLKWFHSVCGNWGLAIILLTLVVRSLVLPLYVASFKSTRAMQKIQPQMKAIREKYKDNPQTMNAEVMRLFKENRVNPLGGCLPMLLQFPIFIALYRVLSQSIELYQSPFILWIKDLSVKDPFYIVPVLMGVAMFAQQRITPMTTADPAQQKVMMFMPIIFSFMMLSLPSGLTLYIFVSTLFGIAQQLIFIGRNPTAAPAQNNKRITTAKA